MHCRVNVIFMMKFCLNWGGAALLSMLLLCTSCGDADLFDTDKWTNEIEGWEPCVSLKVLQGSFTLWDLINQGDDDVVVKEENDLIIQYTEEGIYHIDIDQVFDMPAEDVAFDLSVPVDIPGTGIPLPSDITLGGEDNPIDPVVAEIQNIPSECVLKKLVASADFIFPQTEFSYTLEAKFPNIKTKEGDVLTIVEKVEANEIKTLPLEDIELSLESKPEVSLNIVKIIIHEGSSLSSSKLNFNFKLNNLKFKKAEGKITVDPIAIDPDKFNMDIDFLDEIGGKFKFTKPELNIILRNKGIGVPMSVDATFYGQNAEGDTLTLKLEKGKELLTLGNKSNIVFSDTLGLNKDNSNIVDFLSLPPTGDIFYQGTVTVNPQGDEDNVIYSDGGIDLDAYVRIPFALSAEGLNYKDTLNDIDIDPKYADRIKEGVITITAVNGLPLNLQIPTLVLLGENGGKLESLTAVKGRDIIQAANGKESVLEFNLTQAQAKKLGQTENILLEVKASTTNNQEVVVAADAKLSFDLKLVAKAVITDLDDF